MEKTTKRGLILAGFLVLLFFALQSIAFAGTVELPKTGQTTSYYARDDGDLEMGVACPSPRFTDNGDGTVKDNLTGLVWTMNANPAGTYMTWGQALNYVAGMNAGTYPNYGYTDWRLPNVNELKSLIDNSKYSPALPSGHPFINVSNWYWSSTTCAAVRAARGSSPWTTDSSTTSVSPATTATCGLYARDNVGDWVVWLFQKQAPAAAR